MGGPQHLGVACAAMKAFVDIHKTCKVGDFKEPATNTPEKWLNGRDTGTSSCTIYAVMMNRAMERYDVPHDPQDFGRCYRMLKLFPEWIPRLGEVAARFSEWVPFVREWAKLTEMYERELALADKTYPMYNFMQTLKKEKVKP